jgi:replicative DNA helicase
MREREDFRSRHLEVSHIIRRVKEFAKELKLAFIVISSVSRGNEELPPTLSLLKESGDIEFASDGVVFIHSEKEKEDLKFLNIAKNRWGWTGEVKIFWDGPKTKFRDYQKEGIDESD